MPVEHNSQFQHHVPRFYLPGWSCIEAGRPKRVWVYRKNERARHSAIKETGGRDNMYAVTKSDGSIDLDTVEKYIATVESKAGTVLPKVLRHEPLSAVDKKILAHFLSVMYRRDTYTLDSFAPRNLKPMLPGLKEQLRRKGESFADGEQRAEYFAAVDEAIELSAKNVVSVTSLAILNSDRMASFFNQLNWTFFYSCSSKLLTSDCPVIFNRFRGMRDPAHGHILFPLSTSTLLWMTRWPIGPTNYTEIAATLVDDLNGRIIRNSFKEVYADHASAKIADQVNECMGQWLPHTSASV